MKMIIAVVNNTDSGKLVSALVKNKFQVTKLASSGGFLREGNTTVMVGAKDDQIDRVLELIKTNCKARDHMITPVSSMGVTDSFVSFPLDVKVGGATVFVLPVEQFHKF